jgi:hypothetical protein
MLHRVHRPASAPAADLASHLPQWKLDAQATQAAHAKDAAAMQAATATVAAQHGPGVLASEAVHVCVCVCVCVCVRVCENMCETLSECACASICCTYSNFFTPLPVLPLLLPLPGRLLTARGATTISGTDAASPSRARAAPAGTSAATTTTKGFPATGTAAAVPTALQGQTECLGTKPCPAALLQQSSNAAHHPNVQRWYSGAAAGAAFAEAVQVCSFVCVCVCV